jgi:hypothetical protein
MNSLYTPSGAHDGCHDDAHTGAAKLGVFNTWVAAVSSESMPMCLRVGSGKRGAAAANAA